MRAMKTKYQVLTPNNKSPLAINIRLKNGRVVNCGMEYRHHPLTKTQAYNFANHYPTHIIMPWKTWKQMIYFI